MSMMATVGIHLTVTLEELVVVGPVPISNVPKLIIIVLVLVVRMAMIMSRLQNETMPTIPVEIFEEIDHRVVIMVPRPNEIMKKIPVEIEEIVRREVTMVPHPNETMRKTLEQGFEEIARQVVVPNHLSKEVVERDLPPGTMMTKQISVVRFI